MNKMKYFLILVLDVFIFSCATKTETIIPDKSDSTATKIEKVNQSNIYKNIDLPNWVYNNSSCGEYSVCINDFSANNERMLKQSEKDATVLMAQNIACFVIDKKAKILKYINENTYADGAKFALQVADSFALQKVKDNIHLIAEQKVGAYYFTFYSLDENQEIVGLPPLEILEELPEVDIIKNNSSIIAFSSYEARDLKYAFRSAIKLARKKLAKYLETNVGVYTKYKSKFIEKKKLTKENSSYKVNSYIEAMQYIKGCKITQINVQKRKSKYKVLLKMEVNLKQNKPR